MWLLGPIGFAAPWLLLGLAALPLLWLLLRAVPPAPVRRLFPGVALLLGLKDRENQSDRTPWWLLLLRVLAIALIVIGFAGPVLNPAPATQVSNAPLLIIADGTWADARDWDARQERIGKMLDLAARQGRTVALAALTDPPVGGVSFQTGDRVAASLPGLEPKPWEPDPAAIAAFAAALTGAFDTYWLSDGLARDTRGGLLDALETHGAVTVFQEPRQTLALRPALYADGLITLTALRTPAGTDVQAQVAAIGPDPAGIERQLATATLDFAPGEAAATVQLSLPPEMRNRVTRFEILGQRSAAAVSLTDDSLRRREVALISGSGQTEGLELLSPLHYLRKALEPTAELIGGTLADVLPANPDVIVLADVATMAEAEKRSLEDWVSQGGMLLRFAGPRLAASDVSRNSEDPLMPVRLRAGGRSIGGAMSWGDPKALAPFAEASPFHGLHIPNDVSVTTQVVAQPDPTLATRAIAQLADGTPLVTRKAVGEGQVVLFHVTANAEWSSLPLSGLFVQMLERLAIAARPAAATPADLAGTTWVPAVMVNAFGHLEQTDTLPGVAGERLVTEPPGPTLPPGLYAGAAQRLALNVTGAETTLAPAAWPARITVEGLAAPTPLALNGWLLGLALLLLALDVLATLMLAGRLRGARADVVAGLALSLMVGLSPQAGRAQDADAFALAATSQLVLAHVMTGDSGVDEVAAAGLLGLSNTLFQRTSIEPARPIGVDIERDELAFFPFLYWPVTAAQPMPTREAYAKLNRYLQSGGMILFDTRDADAAGFGSASPEGRRLRAIARGLDIPPLEPIPSDHVLTRTFYLLQDFPGRDAGGTIWVEAAPADAVRAEGMPFRNLNDGVTPVVIGGNDWAAAWAVTETGARMFPVGRGMAGERQREIALRFGVNLIMHVLTGNYKSDQVHVPALLDRLGQ